jgi:hypothetical protein
MGVNGKDPFGYPSVLLDPIYNRHAEKLKKTRP